MYRLRGIFVCGILIVKSCRAGFAKLIGTVPHTILGKPRETAGRKATGAKRESVCLPAAALECFLAVAEKHFVMWRCFCWTILEIFL